MRSLSLVRMPCFRRCSMISTTSPNHEGVEGTECEEVWMMTEESAILVMCTSLLGKMCILPQERHILCLLATNYISLRNSWAWESFCSTFKGECVERHPFHTYGKPKVRREQLDTPIAPFSLRLFSSRDCLRR